MPLRLPPLRESPRRRIAAATALCGLVLVALGAASRADSVGTRDSVPFNPRPAEDQIVVGVIASSDGPGARADRELVRGLTLWSSRLENGGIAYRARHAVAIHGRFGGELSVPVRLEVVHTHAPPENAALAARDLLRRGAQILVAPTSPDARAAVARFAARRRVLLLSTDRPTSARPPSTSTWLRQPAADQLNGTVATISAQMASGTATGPVAILYAGGSWRERARRAAADADRRHVPAVAFDVARRGTRGALAAAGRLKPSLIVAFAPLGQAGRWFRTARAATPWVIVADEAAQAAHALRRLRVAVEVPWSPATPRSGALFANGAEFTAAYAHAYGGIPTTEAAAGAGLGLTVSSMVPLARSTDPTRMLRAREYMDAPSVWGALTFDHGEERLPNSQLVLVDHGRVRQIAPPAPSAKPAQGSRLLRSSVPPGR